MINVTIYVDEKQTYTGFDVIGHAGYDEYGHDKGDILIKNASRILCHVFTHSPVYRIGGDEFVVVLTDEDYKNRIALLDQLVAQNKGCYEKLSLEKGEASFSIGMAEYRKEADVKVEEVFARADQAMYRNKKEMKAGKA